MVIWIPFEDWHNATYGLESFQELNELQFQGFESYNEGHNTLRLFDIYQIILSPKVKRNVIISN